MYEREIKVASAAVRKAAVLCADVLESRAAGTLRKGDMSPVTVADFGSQAIVCRDLEDAFPEDPVMAEESSSALDEAATIRRRVVAHVRAVAGLALAEERVLAWIDRGTHADYAGRFWVLDPIDGTKGFLRGDQYAVALALVVDGAPVAACLACPSLPDLAGGRGVLVTAVRGAGARAMPLNGPGPAARLSVSATDSAGAARFCESVDGGHSSHQDAAAAAAALGVRRPPVRMDSQAKYVVVARGEADFYLRLPKRQGYLEKVWDHAAGSLLVEEAGGRVTDARGRALDFSRGRTLACNLGLVVTNGLLHDRVLGAVEATLAMREAPTGGSDHPR